MPAQIIINSIPLGTPGDLTRDVRECTIEPYHQLNATPVAGYGLPVKQSAGSVTGIVGGDVAASIVGLLVREYPAQGGSLTNQGIGAGTPPLTGVVGILKKGYIAVQVGGVTTGVTKEGVVYVRVAAAAGGKPIGGIEAVSDSTNTIVLTNAQFMGPVDANGVAEIRYNV